MNESSKAYQKNIEEADRLLKTLAELSQNVRPQLNSPRSPRSQYQQFDSQTPAKEMEPDDFIEPQPSSSTPQPHNQYDNRPPAISPSPASRSLRSSQRASAASSRSVSPSTPYSPSIDSLQTSPNKMSPGHEERLKNYHMYKDKIGRNSVETRELRDRYRRLENKVRDLSMKLKEAAANNEKLQMKIDKDAKQTNTRVQDLKQAHVSEIQELNDLLNQYQSQLQVKQKEVERANVTMKEFEKRLSQAEKSQVSKNKADEIKIQRLTIELEEREEVVEAQSKEIEKLKNAIADIESKEDNTQEVKNQLKEQKEKNRKLQQDNRLFNRTVKELQMQHDMMHTTLSSSQDENKRLKERIQTLKTEHEGLYETNNQISEQVESLRESMNEDNERLKLENQKLHDRMEKLEDELQAAQDVTMTLEKEINEKGNKLEHVKRQLHKANTALMEANETRVNSEEVETLKLTTHELELENEALQLKVESLQLELKKARSNVASIQKELSTTKDTIEHTLTPRTKGLEKELLSKEDAYNRLYEDLLIKEDEITELSQQLEDASMRTSLSKEEILKRENMMNDQESTIESLRERVNKLELESVSIREINAQLKFALKNKKDEVKALDEKLNNMPTLGDEMQSFKQKYMDLMDKRDDLQEKYDQMIANNHHFKKSTGEKLDTLEHVNGLLKNQVKKLKKALEDKQEHLDDVTKEAIDYRHYKKASMMVEKERDALQDSIESLEAKLKNRENQVDTLQAELLATQTEYHDFKQESSDSLYLVEELKKANTSLHEQLVQQRSEANDNFYETINNVKRNESDLLASRKHILTLETRIRSQEELIQDLEKRCQRVSAEGQVKVNREVDRCADLEKDLQRARELVGRIKEAKAMDRVMYEEKIEDLERKVRHLKNTKDSSESFIRSPIRHADHKEELQQLASSYELRLKAAAEQKRLDDAQIDMLQRKLADVRMDSFSRSDLFNNSSMTSPLRTLTPSRPSSPIMSSDFFKAPDLSNY